MLLQFVHGRPEPLLVLTLPPVHPRTSDLIFFALARRPNLTNFFTSHDLLAGMQLATFSRFIR